MKSILVFVVGSVVGALAISHRREIFDFADELFAVVMNEIDKSLSEPLDLGDM